jgi:polar amino acid transport system substrate-binding protein
MDFDYSWAIKKQRLILFSFYLILNCTLVEKNMKKWLWILRNFIALFFLVSNSLVNAETCVLKVRVTNIPPLFSQNKTGEWTGLTVDLAKVLLNEAGCKGDFKDISWKRSLIQMRTGHLDMMMNLSMTEERKEFIHFIGPQIDETVQLILKEEIDIDIQSLDDFKKLPGKIGYQRGTFVGKAFEEKLRTDQTFKNKFDILYSDELNLRKLKGGRIIGIIGQNYGGVSAKREFQKGKGYKIHPFIIFQNWVYFGFSKKSVSKEKLDRLEKAYQTAKTKGNFQRVIDSYK